MLFDGGEHLLKKKEKNGGGNFVLRKKFVLFILGEMDKKEYENT